MKLFVMPPPRRIERGVNRALTTCPRCGQTMVDEGHAYYCKYGCARMWPKLGALVIDRVEFERRSGLVTMVHALADHETFKAVRWRRATQRYSKAQQAKRRQRIAAQR